VGEPLKWKAKLVSSSLPLEFEAAKILVAKRFYITADFTYARSDSGIMKDFSVDLYARGFPPFSNPNEILGAVELLVECKQRQPRTSWLFLPDPNQADLSLGILGHTLRAVDGFSRSFFHPNATVTFDRHIGFCYKGIEIDESNGSVYDAELRHGIMQLQYALPRLYTESVLFNVTNHPDDNNPFLFSPILLTTASLFIAHKRMTTRDVENASCLKDIADPVPYLVLYFDYGPDFESHCIKECSPLLNLSKSEALQAIEAYRRENGEYDHLLPSAVARSFAKGLSFELRSHFTHFIVCTMKDFPLLLDRIKRIAVKSFRNLQPKSARPIE
jgi:hypothetical protein